MTRGEAQIGSPEIDAGGVAAAGLFAGMLLGLVELALLFVDVADVDVGQLSSLAGKTTLVTVSLMLLLAPLGGAAMALIGWQLLRPRGWFGRDLIRRLLWFLPLVLPLAGYLAHRPLVVRQLGSGRWLLLVGCALALAVALQLAAALLGRAVARLHRPGALGPRIIVGVVLVLVALAAFALDRTAFPQRYLPLHWVLTALYLAALSALGTAVRTAGRYRRPVGLAIGYLILLLVAGALLESSWTARFYLQRRTAFTARTLFPLSAATALRHQLRPSSADQPAPPMVAAEGAAAAIRRRLRIPADRAPNIFLITIDSAPAPLFAWHRAATNRAGVDGAADPTPYLTRLAGEALVFHRAYAPSSSTHTTLAAWGDAGRLWNKPRPVVPRLYQRLGAAGYQRVCIFPRSAYDPGCDFFARLDKLAWIDAAMKDFVDRLVPGKPLFVQLHLMETHRPWAPSGNPAFGSGDRAAWRGAARRVDTQLARWIGDLRRRQLMNDAVVIVTADHGEAFGENGVNGHSTFLYEEETQVPLFLWSSRGIAGAKHHRPPVSNGWLGPTILALSGRVPQAALGGPTIFDGPVYLREGDLHALVVGPHKLISDLTRHTLELYDVVSDPAETRNLADSKPALRERMLARLRALAPEAVP